MSTSLYAGPGRERHIAVVSGGALSRCGLLLATEAELRRLGWDTKRHAQAPLCPVCGATEAAQ